MSLLFTIAILAVLEVSLSFDNAVVNAKVLRGMPRFMQSAFLSVGWITAVVGVRLLLPVAIVAFSAHLPANDVLSLAVENPGTYANYLAGCHGNIAAFGGTFLMLIFLCFIFNEEKEDHWLHFPEYHCAWLAKGLGNINVLILSSITAFLMLVACDLPWLAGVLGIGTFIIIRLIGDYIQSDSSSIHAGLLAFLYLEILDASFSMDGVAAAFAVSNNIYAIMAGLGIGSLAIRFMTVYMVRKGMLDELPYLEHGAMWGIGVLAALMFAGQSHKIPESLPGIVAATAICLSVISSFRHKQIAAE